MTTSAPPPPSGGQAVATLVRAVTAGELAGYRDAVRTVLDSPAPGGGTPTPSPVHPFVLAHQAFELAFGKIGATRADGTEPTRVHLSQEIRVDRPLRPDERVTVEVDLLGARREAGGVRVALRAMLVGADGTQFAELVTGALLGGAVTPAPFGELPPFPAHRGKATGTVLSRQLTRDSVRRYAEVSGDDNPIHLDDAAAEAAGFDGVIAHGMSVLAMVCEEVVDRHAGGDATLVREIGVRFSTPVRPGEPVDITLQPAGDTVCFSCRTPHGLALKGGWVTLGEPPLLSATEGTIAST
ncbi:MaoC family dehydratase [Actinophytocola gossypii]|uniref:MaoC family dehydratase n=1 Tax=Actinophytocola gossypii TaxID=2812003 RepID=A0ABT2J2D8_9PSEU|nr:MaoC family dehydratase [Actinophytocola gossypii]MCT2581973.1 MaoC family dehydratase [Actinophytocola gossypii]